MPEPLSHMEAEAGERASALYGAKAKLYEVLFVSLIGYGAAIRSYLKGRVGLTSGMKVLDAGCGTGLLTRCLWARARDQGAKVQLHGFDLSPHMLERFLAWMMREKISEIELRELNVLDLTPRPDHWRDYDLIVTAAMLEYVPRTSLPKALMGLKELLLPGGKLILFITRRTGLTEGPIGRWWEAELYSDSEITEAAELAGFDGLEFKPFPGIFRIAGRWIIAAEMTVAK